MVQPITEVRVRAQRLEVGLWRNVAENAEHGAFHFAWTWPFTIQGRSTILPNPTSATCGG